MSEDADVVLVEDKDGNTMKLGRFRGTHVPAFPGVVERLRKLPSFVARDDDIIINAYPKSGTHWTWEITNMLIRGKAETLPVDKEQQFLECQDQDELVKLPSPRVLNMHLRPICYPPNFIEKKCKILHIMRNPKDAFVSYYHHTKNMFQYDYQDGKWPAYFDVCMAGKCEYGDWFEYVLEWERFYKNNPELPLLNLCYEEMLENLSREVRRINTFLGTNADDKLCDAIAEACTFRRMKKSKAEVLPREFTDIWVTKENLMYRKGVAGDWKNWFTVAQNERFDAEFDRRMKGSSLKIRWS